MNSRVLLKFS